MTERYILEDNVPVPEPDLMKWARWFETAPRSLRRTNVGEVLVSTVFLGLDHQFGVGPPLLFETMVFRDDKGDECERCSTWAEAEAQHDAMVARIKP